MKQLSLLLLAIIFLSLQVIGQNQKTKRINGSDVTFRSFGTKAMHALEENEFHSTYYFVLWVNDNVDNSELDQLQKEQVTLHKGMGENLYWASATKEGMKKLAGLGIAKGVAGSTAINKFEKAFQKFEVPEFAITEDDQVKLIISYYGVEDEALIRAELEKFHCNGIKINTHFSSINCILPKEQVYQLSKLPWITSINAGGRIFKEYDMSGNKRHGVRLFDYHNPGYNLTGKGVNIGVWDGNAEEHMDMKGRIHIQEKRIEGSDHGIHVSGILAGNGLLNPEATGVATEAELYNYNYDGGDYDDQITAEEMIDAVEDFGISITQNSYGILNLGADLIPYLSSDANLDIVANEYPNLLHVFAVGNNKLYFDYNTATTSAKNILQVANIDVEGYRNSASSFGPTSGGHLIPHIAAYGTSVLSTSYLNEYSLKSGTSMSCPLVSGAAAQMVQLYREKYNEEPPAALLKAAMCNTAYDIDFEGPDYQSGYGILNHLKALNVLKNGNFILSKVEDNYTTEHQINIPSGTKALRVMIVWNDPWTYPTYDNPLVNDLDLMVQKDGQTYYPWVLDPDNPDQASTKGKNKLDNMEQIVIDDPEPGLYNIVVDGKGILFDADNKFQDYAIVYEFIKPELTLFTPVYESVIDVNENLFLEPICEINWFNYGLSGDISVELSKDGGKTFDLLDEISELDVYYSFPLPDNFDFDYQVRLKQGGIYSESKVIKAMRRPEISVAQTGASEIEVKWDAIIGANEYKVFEITDGEISELATTVETAYTIDNITNENSYFAVQAFNTDIKISSIRSKAVKPDIRKDITELPFYEGFEVGGLEYFFEQPGISTIRKDTENNNTSLLFLGNSGGPNNYSNNNEYRFSDYAFYVSSATTAKISIPENGRTILSLDLKVEKSKIYSGENANEILPYFRLLANGDSIPELSGNYDIGGNRFDLIYTGNMKPELHSTYLFFPFKSIYYDLSQFAGQEIILDFQALIPYSSLIQIDNIAIETVVDKDIAVVDYKQVPSGINLEPQTITALVANLGKDTITTVDLKYTIDKGLNAASTSETFNITLAPFTSEWVSFEKAAEFNKDAYSHIVEISVDEDDNKSINNSQVIENIDNYNPQVPLYYDNETIVVDSFIYFTDGGTDRYDNSIFAGQRNFIPADPSKVLKFEFEEFDIREGDDFRIFSGVFGTDGLIDTMKIVHYTSSVSNPADIISGSPSGGFLVHWRGYAKDYGKGWKIKVSEVDPVQKIDARIRKIISPVSYADLSEPSTVKLELWNFGRDAINSMVVSYQINKFPEIYDTISFYNGLQPNERYVHKFSEEADLTEFGETYTITYRIYLDGDQHPESNTLVDEVKNTYPMVSFTHVPPIYLYNMTMANKFYQAEYWYSFDNSDLYFNVEYNNSYEVAMYMGGSHPLYNYEYEVQILVDWNSDGDFNDKGELTLAPLVDASSALNIGNLIIPNNTTSGKKRMRINTLALAGSGEILQGNQTDFSLMLSGTPTLHDAAIVKQNFPDYTEPITYTPEFTIKQIGAINDTIYVSLDIGENYSQVSSTIIDVNEEQTFTFPAIELTKGTYNIELNIEQDQDVNLQNNSVTQKATVYSFSPSFMAQETGLSHFDFANPKMNMLRIPVTNTDSLGYFFGTYAKDAYYVYKRVLKDSYHSVALVKYDSLLQKEDTVFDYGYDFNDILGVAYSDKDDSFYSLTSLSRHKETYVTKKYDLENNELVLMDTIQASGHYLKNLAGLASDCSGNLYTLYKPQNLLCQIDSGTGELLGMAIIPEELKEAIDITLELDKNTGNFIVTVDDLMYIVQPMSRQAQYYKSMPVSAWGLGVAYDTLQAYNVAELRGIRLEGQSQPSVYSISEKSIKVEMPWYTDLSKVVPSFITVNGGTVSINGNSIESGVSPIDLSGTSTLMVTSKDGQNTQTWTIGASLRNKTELMSFSFLSSVNASLETDVRATIENNVISIDLPIEADIYNLIASFEISTESGLYMGGEQLLDGYTEFNYSDNLILTVISSDGVDQINYLLRINRGINNSAFIKDFRLLTDDNADLSNDCFAEAIDNNLYLGFEDTTLSFVAIPRFSHAAGSKVISDFGLLESGIGSLTIAEGKSITVVSEDETISNTYILNMGTSVGTIEHSFLETSLYPNPVNDKVVVTNAENSQLRVTNMLGKTVLQTNILLPEQMINVTHLAAGIYVFELKNSVSKKSFKVIIEK